MPVSTLSDLCSVQPLPSPSSQPPPPPQPPPLLLPQQHKPPPLPIIHPQGASSSSNSSTSSLLQHSPPSPILLQQSPPSPASVSNPSSPSPVSDNSCPHCQEEYGGEQQRPVYWRIQLDRDLLETILAIYPEWFKDCNLDLLNMAEGPSSSSGGGSGGGEGGGGSAGGSAGGTGLPLSPPKAEVDDSPLQKCMDKNKESLKVKLMLRRPINQLVAQGIMPPLKTPPAFHEQRQKLERAKMGDLLKAKIQQRPDRQELVRQHILESEYVGHVDPSLAERQRMLKKARLQDSLNDQLSHRPGPLELIKKNILHTDETIERAVKDSLCVAPPCICPGSDLACSPRPDRVGSPDSSSSGYETSTSLDSLSPPASPVDSEGQIPFRATCEGQLTKPQHPNRYITYEEDSSSEGGQSPPQHSTLLQTAQGQLLISTSSGTMCFDPSQSVMVPVSVVSCSPAPAPSPSVTSSTSSLSPISSVASPQSTAPSPALVATPILTLPAPPPPPPPPPPTPQVTTTITVQHISSQPAPVVTLPTLTPTPTPTPILTAVSIPTPRPISRAEKEQQSLKNRKKSKTKSQPKTRTIKFHEYKGPPNAQKASNNSPPPVETSYELLLQQQQLFLQWQLEWQHKYPQIILPAAQKPSPGEPQMPSLITVTTSSSSQPPPTPSPSLQQQQLSFTSVPSPASSLASPGPPATPQPAPPTPTPETIVRTVNKLEDMKVSDLKAELKRRNLPVSGSKPQLIERLRPFSEQMGMQLPSQQPPQPPSHSLSQSEQPPTPGSNCSNHSHFEPRSVGTLALGDDSLSGLSMETPVSPMGDNGGILSLDSCLSQDGSTSSSGGSLGHSISQPSSPLSLGPLSQPPTGLLSPAANMDVDIDMEVGMDTTAPDTPGSPTSLQAPSPVSPPSPPQPQQSQQVLLPLVSEDIITQQQRKIEQLQRELQRSQQLLQRVRSKEQQQATASQQNPGDVSTKNHLQQHLQHKMQQQHLQEQLQHLQQLQSLQQQQQQTLRQQASSQLQQGLSAKASLAAFLQQQQQSTVTTVSQPQVTMTPMLLSITTTTTAAPASQPATTVTPASNNNNNNNNVTPVMMNNKHASKSQQQRHRLALNQLNLQKQRNAIGPLPNGLSNTHQRTASLPNFFGSFGQQQSPAPASSPAQTVTIVQPQQPHKVLTSQSSEPHFLISKPPPLYEEATKLLKVKQEPNTQTTTKQKHIKSQTVDDVLEILIKNGELPASAAQDPATPTTPGQSMPQGLVFKTTSQTSPAPAEAATPPPPPPPPPPPLPQQQQNEFPMGLTSLLGEHISLHDSKPQMINVSEDSETAFTMSQLDMILGQTGNNPQPMSLANHPLAEMSSSTPAPTIDLKDLGLDLETLDTMDFSQLDSIKLEASDLLEEKLRGGQSEEEPMEGVVSAGDMPMDLDVSDWLESLLPSTSSPMTSQQQQQQQQQPITNQISQNSLNMFGLTSSNSDLDSYDPLLCNSQDVFDLFNLEDTDLKMTTSDINNLNWDKVDFAT